MELAQFSRPRRRRRDRVSIPRDQGGDSATFQTKGETAQFFRSGRRGRDFLDQGGDGTTFQTKAETARPRINFSPPRQRQRDFPDQGKTARLFRPRRRGRDFPDQGEDDGTFEFKAETVRFFRSRRKRRDCPDRGRQGDHFRNPFSDFHDQFPQFRDQILVCPEFCCPRRDSCPNFSDSNSRRDYAFCA